MEDPQDLSDNLGNEFPQNKKKKLIVRLIIIFSIIIVLAIIAVIIVFTLPKNTEDKKDDDDEDGNPYFKILLNDSQIDKPLSSNLETEIIQLKNGLTAILISEKNFTISSIDIETPYGSNLDFISGFAHFAEHMVYRGGKKFPENSYVKTLDYIGDLSNAFTTIESTNFYMHSKVGTEFERIINILADSLSNPRFNKSEINNVHHEFLMSNNTDDYILNNILYSLTNENHPFHNAFSIGNNESLNEVNENDMEKYLTAYYQDVYNPKNLVVLLRANKNLNELEDLIMKYFNYNINVNETIGNKEREDIKKKIKEEKLFNKDNGGKILKYYNKIANNLNSSVLYNLLTISFGIDNMVYKDGFNPIDFLQFLFKKTSDSSLHNYLISKKYIISIENKIYIQFFERETGFIHIYIYLTEKGLNNLEEVIKAIFHYLNLIINSLNEIENELFPNYQKLKINQFNYKYDENEDYDLLNRQTIINMRKHGMKNIFKNDVPEKFDREFFIKFMEDKINIENAIISLNSNYDINNLHIFDGYKTKYIKYYGNEFNVTDLKTDFIESLKKFPVDESLSNIIKLRNINEYFTNISKPTDPCYYISREECINKKEFNPLIDLNYKKERCDNNDTYICYYANDRSLLMPKVEITLKLKTQSDSDLSPTNKYYFNTFYLSPVMLNYFCDFLEDKNNKLSISYDSTTDEFIFVIDTYKDIAKNILEKAINRLLNLFDENDYNYVKDSLINDIYINIGASTLNIEEYNPGAVLDLFEYGQTNKNPDLGKANLNLLNQFNYQAVTYIHSKLIKSFISYTKLYLIGDLSEELISDLANIVKERIILNQNNEINNNIVYNLERTIEFNNKENEIHSKLNSQNYVFFNENQHYNKENNILNKFSNFILNNNIQIAKDTVVNYIYSNENKYEKNSYTGIFYAMNIQDIKSLDVLNIFYFSISEKIYTELRTKRGYGYRCLSKSVNSIGNTLYLYFYVLGAMKTPIQIQDDINTILNEIFTTWEPDDFDSIVKNYLNYYKLIRSENPFSKRVKAFIQDNQVQENKSIDYLDVINDGMTFREIADIMKKAFEHPVRIGIFEYANYIEKDFIENEIKNRTNEKYYFNENLTVNYTFEINYFR